MSDASTMPTAGRLPTLAGVARSLADAGAPPEALLKARAEVAEIADLSCDAARADSALVAAYEAGLPVDPPVVDGRGNVLFGAERVASAAAAGCSEIFVARVGKRMRKGTDDEVGDFGLDDDELLSALAGSLGGEAEELLLDASDGGGELQADALDADWDGAHPDVVRRVRDVRTRLEDVLDETTAHAVRDAIRRGIEDGDTEDDMVERLSSLGEFGKARARRIARTETHNAVMGGAFESARQAGVRHLQWLGASDARKTHVEATGQVVKTGEPFQVGDALLLYPGDPVGGKDYPEEVINCFAPGTVVHGRINLVFRARYAGPMREILTRSGNRLAVTPNHPVCAACGVVAAKDVKQGDKLVSYSGFVEVAELPSDSAEDQHVPAKVEDVFRALWSGGRKVSFIARESSGDFHGDAEFFAGDVDVIAIERELACDTNAAGCEDTGDAVLVHTSLASGFVPCGRNGGSHSAVLPLKATRFGCASHLDFPLREHILNGSSRDSAYLRDFYRRNPSLVFSDDFVEVAERRTSVPTVDPLGPGPHRCSATDDEFSHCFPADGVRGGDGFDGGACGISAEDVGFVRTGQFRASAKVAFTRTTYSDAEFLEFPPECERGNAEGCRELVEGASGKVFLDEVVGIREYEFVGHVYDLQSENGLIVANGVCCGNCRCTTLALFDDPTTPDDVADELEIEDVDGEEVEEDSQEAEIAEAIREAVRRRIEEDEVARLDTADVEPLRVRRDSNPEEASYDPDLELVNVGDDADPDDLADAVREHLVGSGMTDADARGFLNELAVYDLPEPAGNTEMQRAVAGVVAGVTDDRDRAEELLGEVLDDDGWEVYKAVARQFWVGIGTEGAVPVRRERVAIEKSSDVRTEKNCGTGAGGFQPGNTCASEGLPKEERDRLRDWARTRPDDEVDAVRAYSGSAYMDINPVSRGAADGDSLTRARIKAIDAYIEASPRFAKPVVVWRGMGARSKERADARLRQFAESVGKRVRMDGFQSSSLSKSVAQDFSSGVLLKITTERGAPVWPMLRQIEGEDAWENNEQEVLLGRGWTYRVDKVDPPKTEDGLAVVHLVAEGLGEGDLALKADRGRPEERKFSQPEDAIVFLDMEKAEQVAGDLCRGDAGRFESCSGGADAYFAERAESSAAAKASADEWRRVLPNADPAEVVRRIEAVDTPIGWVKVRSIVAEYGRVSVFGNVELRDGTVVGRFTRTFDREDGELVVGHSFFRVDEKWRGNGIGAALNEGLEEMYKGMGASHVRIFATQVGKYAWARQGYDFKDAADRDAVGDDIVSRLVEAGADASWAENFRGKPAWVMAAAEFRGAKIGKAALLSRFVGLEMRKSLKDGDAGYEVGRRYFEEARRERERKAG